MFFLALAALQIVAGIVLAVKAVFIGTGITCLGAAMACVHAKAAQVGLID